MDAILLYDGSCGVCGFAKTLVTLVDVGRRIRPMALQDPEATRLLAGMPEDRIWSSFHIVRDGRATSRGDAIIELLGVLPLGRGIPDLAARMPKARGASERLYGVLSRLRGALVCAV